MVLHRAANRVRKREPLRQRLFAHGLPSLWSPTPTAHQQPRNTMNRMYESTNSAERTTEAIQSRSGPSGWRRLATWLITGIVWQAGFSLKANVPGELDPTFDTGTGMINGRVLRVLLPPDGRPVIGGLFSAVEGAYRGGVARLNTDGSVAPTFLDGLAGLASTDIFFPIPSVSAFALQSDGKFVIGGRFNLVNGVPRDQIARLHGDGGLDSSFLESLSGVNGLVLSLALQGNGKPLVGGSFTGVNGVPRIGVVRLLGGTGAPPIRLAPPSIDAGEVGFAVTGTPGETFDIQRAVSPEGPWNTIGNVQISQEGTGNFQDANPPADGAFYRMARF